MNSVGSGLSTQPSHGYCPACVPPYQGYRFVSYCTSIRVYYKTTAVIGSLSNYADPPQVGISDIKSMQLKWHMLRNNK